MLAGVGTILALAGIGAGLGDVLLRRSDLAGALAARFRPLYVLLFNRYWIDELYCWLMDKFIIAVAFGLAWFDTHVIDGVVNGVGKGTTVAGDWLRGLQTGASRPTRWPWPAGWLIIASGRSSSRTVFGPR